MLSRIRTFSRRTIAVLSKNRSPAQVACGASLGAILGLMPKDNLLAIIALVALTCCRFNQLVGVSVAILLSLLGNWSTPFIERIGALAIENGMFATALTRLYQLPLIPWTCLERPAVAGGFAMGLTCLLPTYAICKWAIQSDRSHRENDQVGQLMLEALHLGQASLVSEAKQPELETISLRLMNESNHSNESHDPNRRKTSITNEVETLPSSVLSKPTSEKPVYPRPRIAKISRNKPTVVVDETSVGQDTILRETIIEVVRYRRPFLTTPADVSLGEKGQLLNGTNRTVEPSSISTGESMSVANLPTSAFESGALKELPRIAGMSSDSTNHSIEAAHATIQATNREESLKYLLSHIASSKDSNRKSGKSA